MKTFALIPLILFLVIPQMAHSLELGGQWLKIREIEGRSSFKLKSNPKVFLSVQQRESDGKKDYSANELRKLEHAKKKTLTIIGIHDYKVLKRNVGRNQMTFYGDYQSATGAKTNFIEKHLHKNGSDFQMLIISSQDIGHKELQRELNGVEVKLGGEK